MANEQSQKRAAFWAAAFSAFLTPFMMSAVNVALPALGRDFNMNPEGLSWVATSYILAACIFLVPVGAWADIHGRKKVFLYGLVAFTAGSLGCGLADSGQSLVGWRLVQGLGGSMIFGTSSAILTSVFPPGERGRVFGFNTATVYLGLSLGPVLGGFMVERLGWRSIFYFNALMGLGVIAVVVWGLKGEWADSRGKPFDWAGSVVYGLSLLALMTGFSRLAQPIGPLLAGCGLAGLAVFGWLETRASNPALQAGLLLKNRVFAFSNLAALVNYSATSAVGFLLSLFLQFIKGLPPSKTGMVLIAQAVVQAGLSPLAGRLSDRMDPGKVASIGMGMTCLGLLAFVFLTPETPLPWVVACLMFIGAGFALFSSPNVNAVMGSVEKQHLGVASAFLGTMRLTGQMFSMAVVMLVFSLYKIGKAQITPQTQGVFLISLRAMFVVFAGLCLAGVFASLARRREAGTKASGRG